MAESQYIRYLGHRTRSSECGYNPDMLVKVGVAILVLWAAGSAIAQNGEPKSLADVARQSKVEKKDQARLIKSDDLPDPTKPLIPDVFSSGIDNSDDILKAIDDYRGTHNLQETEAVVRIWYEKHDALMANAIEDNKRIEQRERDRQLGYVVTDVQPRTQQEYAEAQRAALISRREDLKRKQENGLLTARIQQAFQKVRGQVRSKYGMKVEWFKVRCGNGNCSF